MKKLAHRAAGAEAQFPFLGEGVAAGRGRGVCPVCRAVACFRNGMDSTRNSDDFHITTPPFGHPFLKRRGIRPHRHRLQIK
ncbi:MAG: hypothetical protein PUF10_00015 [Bacteroidales bacterium]|nr:hypothetical protein [Bacteroidales bacterium]